jgi:hypothetical protein
MKERASAVKHSQYALGKAPEKPYRESGDKTADDSDGTSKNFIAPIYLKNDYGCF